MVRCPELLDLISRDREWDLTRNGVGSSVIENNKLELRLGLPGEEGLAEASSCLNSNHENGEISLSSARPFSSCLNIRSNKRALYAKTEGIAGDGNRLDRNDEFQPHKLIFYEKTAEKVSPFTPCLSASLPSSAFQREAQKLSQPSQSSYLKHLLMPQNLDLVSEEPSKPKATELNSCLNSNSVPAESSETKHHDKRASVAAAVGWPPIPSFRKNFAVPRSSKPNSLELSKETLQDENGSRLSDCSNGQMFVKVCMDGVPIGRKLNLQAYNSYDQLSAGIDELFHSLLAAQRNYLAAEDGRKMEETTSVSDSKHKNGLYTLVYYDNEGDRMLVGDVPWKMFVSTVKRLRVLKSSSIAEMLRLNVPKALKFALNNLKDSEYKTRYSSIDDVGLFDSVELSVLLCNDDFIRKLNKEWRDEDHATDVLSMSQHVPELKLPILMLGDIVISVETAARQAEERGHTLLDEIRILLVHGLLHLLGFDHEISEEAEEEMEKEEELLLKSLEWRGKGLIQSAIDAETNSNSAAVVSDDRKKEGSLRFYRPRFSYIFCDMDGTLLNSKSQITPTTVRALKEVLSRGVKVVIATGKARPAVISILEKAGLAGKDGAVSEFSPGVFLQGLLVYGRQGKEIYRRNLDQDVCRGACLYSLEKKVPLIAFGEGRCLTLFDHPLADALHTVYHEPKAEVMSSVENLLAAAEIQKILFLDTAEGVSRILRPYWSEAAGEHASVVQAVPDMLEIVPRGTSKGSGVKMLLDHLGVSAEEVMAIGDGENDIEMLELASLGIALSNGSEKTKAVANLIGPSNDEDGVAEVIYRYAF
ncbi:hypothetical protein IC582_006998 [Cucumis melo]